MADGLLRHDSPYRVWVGMGNARPCAACTRRIGPTDMELELHFERAPTPLRMHAPCFTVWHRVAAQQRQRVTGRRTEAHRSARDQR